MKAILIALLFSSALAILRYPAPEFDLEALRAVDPKHAARVEWMFTRRRRHFPCMLCKVGGRPAKLVPGGYRASYKARLNSVKN